jgi:hypothetical protein
MGFEPTTFCMASRTWGRNLVTNCLQSSGFWRARAVTVAREFTPIYDGLGTEWGPGRETRVDSDHRVPSRGGCGACLATHVRGREFLGPSLGVLTFVWR